MNYLPAAYDDDQYKPFFQRFFNPINPFTLIRHQASVERSQINEDTKTELVRKDASRTLNMADRRASADLRIYDYECSLFEANQMLYLEAMAYLKRKAQLQELLSNHSGLHPILDEDEATIRQIYNNGRKK